MFAMNKLSRTQKRLLAGCSLLAVVGLVLWIENPNKERAVSQLRDTVIRASESPDSHSVAKAWDWQHFSEEEVLTAVKRSKKKKRAEESAEAENAEEVPFDVVVIYGALGNIELGEAGNVVIDHKARHALEASFNPLDLMLDAEELAELQELIRIGLPGRAGEQTAEIVGDYYRYRVAEADFNQTHESDGDLITARNNFEQLVALREAHLGYEVAEKLYGEENALTRYTLKAMQVEVDPGLSAEQKAERWQALSSELPADVLASDSESQAVKIDSADWEGRFSAFERERQYILDAGLSEDDRQAQVDELLAKHFDESEIPVARHYGGEPTPPEEREEEQAEADDSEASREK